MDLRKPVLRDYAVTFKDKCAKPNVLPVICSQLISKWTLDMRNPIGNFLIAQCEGIRAPEFCEMRSPVGTRMFDISPSAPVVMHQVAPHVVGFMRIRQVFKSGVIGILRFFPVSQRLVIDIDDWASCIAIDAP